MKNSDQASQLLWVKKIPSQAKPSLHHPTTRPYAAPFSDGMAVSSAHPASHGTTFPAPSGVPPAEATELRPLGGSCRRKEARLPATLPFALPSSGIACGALPATLPFALPSLRGQTKGSKIRAKWGPHGIAAMGQKGINPQLVDVIYRCSVSFRSK